MRNINNFIYEKLNNKNILVTGGAGFIGGAFVRRILKKTNSRIYNLDKLSYASDLTSIENLIEDPKSLFAKRYQFIKSDISKKDEAKKAIIISDPDYVINFAAESHVDRSIDDPNPFIFNNIIGTFNLLEVLREHFSKLKSNRKEEFRFHHISTDEVFGSLGEEGFFSESSPYDPRSPYSASKASSDHLVKSWNHTYNLPTLITNCSNNFGPWQFPEKLIPLVILKALSGDSIPIYGYGLNIRDWLYVEDHIDAILTVLTKAEPGSNYCVGGFGEKTNKEVVYLICEILDDICPKIYKHNSLIKYVTDRPSHDRRYAIDSKKMRNKFDWKPNYLFEDALKNTINWYVNNQRWCKKVQNNSGYSGERVGLNS